MDLVRKEEHFLFSSNLFLVQYIYELNAEFYHNLLSYLLQNQIIFDHLNNEYNELL